MNRLAFNLVTFTISKGSIIIILLISFINLEELSKLGKGLKSHCKTYENGATFFKVFLSVIMFNQNLFFNFYDLSIF